MHGFICYSSSASLAGLMHLFLLQACPSTLGQIHWGDHLNESEWLKWMMRSIYIWRSMELLSELMPFSRNVTMGTAAKVLVQCYASWRCVGCGGGVWYVFGAGMWIATSRIEDPAFGGLSTILRHTIRADVEIQSCKDNLSWWFEFQSVYTTEQEKANS